MRKSYKKNENQSKLPANIWFILSKFMEKKEMSTREWEMKKRWEGEREREKLKKGRREKR